MATKTASNIGFELNLEWKQGCDNVVDIELTNEDGSVYSTTGFSAVGAMRSKRLSGTSYALDCSFPVNGTLRVAMSRAASALVAVGENIDDDASIYLYDVELVGADSTKYPGPFGSIAWLADVKGP